MLRRDTTCSVAWACFMEMRSPKTKDPSGKDWLRALAWLWMELREFLAESWTKKSACCLLVLSRE